MEKADVKVGHILLSEPFMMDPNFRRSVVLICDHQSDGSVGFILNKPLQMNVEDLLADFPEFTSEVYYGGPVATDTIHYVHNVGNLLENSIEVTRGVFWGGDFDSLKFLIRQKLIQPENIRFYVGYSGWSPGQLEEELEYGSWVIAESDANYIFKSKSRKLWKQIMHNKGDNFEIIAQMPDHISWN